MQRLHKHQHWRDYGLLTRRRSCPCRRTAAHSACAAPCTSRTPRRSCRRPARPQCCWQRPPSCSKQRLISNAPQMQDGNVQGDTDRDCPEPEKSCHRGFPWRGSSVTWQTHWYRVPLAAQEKLRAPPEAEQAAWHCCSARSQPLELASVVSGISKAHATTNTSITVPILLAAATASGDRQAAP